MSEVPREDLQAPVNLPDHYVEAILAAVNDSRRPATRRAYAGAWKRFRAWAGSEGLESIPADPMTVAAYLAYRAGLGLSISSLAMDNKAISYYHRMAGLTSPTTSEGVRQTLSGLRNQAAAKGRSEPNQARGLTGEVLARIRDTACRPRVGPTGRKESRVLARRRGRVDIAVASVMRDALLRRSEAAALSWSDVEFRQDGTARITVRHSKTSTAAAVLFVGRRATEDLQRVRPPDAAPRARVFGLRCGRSISNRIAAMTRAAGLGEGFTGHSPRVGMAQDLTAAGLGLTAIMVAGRWKSVRMPAYYARRESAGRGAVARFYDMEE